MFSKVCSLCGEVKASLFFHKDKNSKDGLTARCGLCRSKKQVELQNRQKAEDLDLYRRRRKSNNYKSKYKVSLQEVEEKLNSQNHKCPICEIDLTKASYVVDHNHTTGQVRDILCESCNKGLGFFYESPKTLQKAIDYLKVHNDLLD